MSDNALSRRGFLGAAAGAAGAAAVGTWAAPKAFSSSPDAIHHKLQPRDRLGVQQFSVRDAVTRRSIANSRANNLNPTMGYLGGPNYPADPTDLGPLLHVDHSPNPLTQLAPGNEFQHSQWWTRPPGGQNSTVDRGSVFTRR